MKAGETCSKCQQPLEMYYSPWCPRCDIPQRKTVDVLNLIQCLDHLQAIGRITEEHREEWWERQCDNDNIHNDTMFRYWPLLPESDKALYPVDTALCEVFKIETSVVFNVSW